MEGRQPPEQGFEPDEAPIDLRAYVAILLKHKWMVLLVLLASVAGTAAYTLRQTPIYAADATVVIDLEPPQVLGDGVREAVDLGAGYYYSNTKEFYETQYKILGSRQLAERTAERLGLHQDPVYLGVEKLPPEEQRALMTVKAAGARLQRSLSILPVKDSRVVRIHVEDVDPDRAAAIANETANSYMHANLERRVDGSREASSWLQQQLTDLKAKLEQSEMALHQFKKENDLIQTPFENRQTISNQRVLALSDSLTRVQSRRAEIEARIELIKTQRQTGALEELMEIGAVADSAFVGQLKLQHLAVSNEVNDLKNRYGSEHPKLQAAEVRLAAARDALEREVNRILRAETSDYQEVVATEQNLSRLLERAKNESLTVNEKEIEYRRLAREEENNRRLYDLVLKRVKEVDLSAMLQANNVRLLDQAEPVPWPIRPRTRVNLLMGALLGLLAGVGLAFLLEMLDRSVKGHQELEAMGLNFLGVVPPIKPKEDRLGSRDLVVHLEPKSVVSESCRTIRSNLLFLNPDMPWRSIVVTSAGPDEGKTTTMVNLGIALAQGGARVLVVDSDMRRSRLHKTFGVPNDIGLSGLIAKDGDLDEAIKRTEVPGLFVLPAGAVPPNPAELLHSERFKKLTEELAKRFDRVIYDSPPVTAVADPLVLANILDGTLVVARAFSTDRDVLERAVKSLRDANARLLGVVLNALDSDRYRYRYKTGYYYRYGDYSYGKDDAAA